MTTITDEMMRERLSKTKAYCVVLLRRGPQWTMSDAQKIIWEHGRRNFELREAKTLSIVCPLGGTTELRGIGIFDAEPDEVVRIMAEDPAVQAGVLVFEVYPGRSFPGDALPQ
jgi:hypothetical protein